MERYKEIERSIIKTYRKSIWHQFMKAVIDYQLVSENDKIMVCISGGKDSFLLAKCMEELQRHGKVPFELKYVVMDPGYSKKHREEIEKTASILNLNIEIFSSDIFEVANKLDKEHPCYLCARMRRGCLYNKAKTLGCNKIALGHHFDDVIETIFLSMLYGAEIKTMMPKLHSENFEGLELIRPLYLVREEDIINWKNYNSLEFINCACKFTEEKGDLEEKSKRKEVKELIKQLKKTNPNVSYNIFKSLDNINLDCVVGYTKDKVKHNFLDEYEEKRK